MPQVNPAPYGFISLPGYNFGMTDCLITNFHLPRTTLFILVCAFAGEKLIKKAYQEAIDKSTGFTVMAMQCDIMMFKIVHKDKKSRARLGKIITAHGEIDTLLLCP